MPGTAQSYVTTLAARVTTTVANAELSAVDGTGGNGRLTNGSFQLATPLSVRATNSANPATAFGPLSATPLTLLTFPAEITANAVTIHLQQTIGQTDALLNGSYKAQVRFVLSTTTP